MPLYKALKIISFRDLGKDVLVDETIELEKDHADKINADLKIAFPDVDAVLVLLDSEADVLADSDAEVKVEVEKPKKTRKKKTDETAE